MLSVSLTLAGRLTIEASEECPRHYRKSTSMTKEQHSVRVECWLCGSTQDLTAEGVPEYAEVSCSYCRAPLGNWQQLRLEGQVGITRH